MSSNEPGPCPCCGKPINDYRESLGSFVCKPCGFMLMGSQAKHLSILQDQRREAEAGRALRKNLAACFPDEIQPEMDAYDAAVKEASDE